MATNIVCSDTYIDAFSKLDKKTQKKSLETIRLMQRSLRSEGLKIEKLNTKIDFKSARVTQDFRAIFTQTGNTILLVYIAHHDDAYLWANKRLKSFDTVSAKPVYEDFEQAKTEDFDTIENEVIDLANIRKSGEPSKKTKSNPKARTLLDESAKSAANQTLENINTIMPPSASQNSSWQSFKKLLFALFFFMLGTIAGIIFTLGHFL